MKCPRCGTEYDEAMSFCLLCGQEMGSAEMRPERKKRSGSAVYVILAIVSALLIAAVYLMVMQNKDRENETPASTKEVTAQSSALPTESAAAVTPNTFAGESSPMAEISSISASSVLPDQYGNSYRADLVLDNQTDTAWVEGIRGDGYGESVTIYLTKAVTISGFYISGGYQKNSDIYYKNSRPENIEVRFPDGTQFQYHLDDYMGSQKIVLEHPVSADSVTFTVLSVYTGNKYEDTAISELKLF